MRKPTLSREETLALAALLRAADTVLAHLPATIELNRERSQLQVARHDILHQAGLSNPYGDD